MDLEDIVGGEGAGYDLLTSQFSPEGRLFQVEYAQKAIQNSGTAIGLIGRDGVVFAVENPVTSPLYESHGSSHTFTVDRRVGAVVAGFMADARHLIELARTCASEYTVKYKSPIPLKHMRQEISMYVHAYTQYSGLRPFGASLILGTYDLEQGPQLFCIEPSGYSQGCFGCAIGKSKEEARSEIDVVDFKEKSILELVLDAARIIYAVHDSDREFELELSWLGKITNGKHERVPPIAHKDAEDYARHMLYE